MIHVQATVFSKVHSVCYNIANGIKPGSDSKRFMVSSLIARRWVRPQTLCRLLRKALIGGLVPDAYL